MKRNYRWRTDDGAGLEHLDLQQREDVVIAEGTVICDGPYACNYRICCDSGWRVRSVEVHVAGGQSIVLTTDGDGSWRDGDGKALLHLQGCVDVDISATPFTNTLPIRRIGSQLGQRTELIMAWIKVPELTIHRAPQAYTSLPDGRYRFEALDSGFEATLEVDELGLVRDYPGLFHRVG